MTENCNHVSKATRDLEGHANHSQQPAEDPQQDEAEPLEKGRLKSADLTISFVKVSGPAQQHVPEAKPFSAHGLLSRSAKRMLQAPIGNPCMMYQSGWGI